MKTVKKKKLLKIILLFLIVGVIITVLYLEKNKLSSGKDSSTPPPPPPPSPDVNFTWTTIPDTLMVKSQKIPMMEIGSISTAIDVPDIESTTYLSLYNAKEDCIRDQACKGVQQLGINYVLTKGSRAEIIGNLPIATNIKDETGNFIKTFNLFLNDQRN